MAKIRVYELARDLNMTNKDLLGRIKSLGISVTSHMASLDDDLAATIKAGIHGKKQSKVEVTRVRSTVIRRRKKQTIEKPVEETMEEPVEEPSGSEIVSEPEQTISAEETEQAEPEKNVEVEKEKIEVESMEVDQPKVDQPKVDQSKVDQSKVDQPKEEKPTEPGATKESPTSDSLKKEPVKTIKPPYKKNKKTGKAEKKDAPAKIIKLPDLPVQKIPEKIKTIVEKPKPDSRKSIQTGKQERIKKKGKQKPEKASQQEKVVKDSTQKEKHWSKKKISFRRKEVVEGKALYSGKKHARKGR
ncbi:MAG: translation initiation factor IF-2 N-terminal domain-containing protein, partial [Desulfosarcina sp.]|nr:translation initiation factor IF-2 N-terminal domain-containing protein [Desulfobacterales bacterium]